MHAVIKKWHSVFIALLLSLLCLSQSSQSLAAEAGTSTVVGIAQGQDYASVTARAIANAGGLSGIVRPGSTVLIKPNLCTDDYLDSPTTTDYRVVAEIVRELKALKPGRIIIAEGPFGPEPFTPENLKRNRYGTIEGVEFFHFNSVPVENCYYVMAKNTLTKKAIYIPKIYVDADVVITVPVMKTHRSGVVSLGLKNALGVPPMPMYNRPRSKQAFHNEFDLSEAIVEINMIRKPDFVVVDGIIAGEGQGPTHCTPVKAETVIAGSDIVAVDAVTAAFMGFNPQRVPHLKLAAQSGLGEIDLNKITVIGGVLKDMVIDFESSFPKR